MTHSERNVSLLCYRETQPEFVKLCGVAAHPLRYGLCSLRGDLNTLTDVPVSTPKNIQV